MTLFQIIKITDILKPKSVLVKELNIEKNDFLKISMDCVSTVGSSNGLYARYVTIENCRNTYYKEMSLNNLIKILDSTVTYIENYK